MDDSSDGNASVKTYPDGKDGNAYYEFNYEITDSMLEGGSKEVEIEVDGSFTGETTSEYVGE